MGSWEAGRVTDFTSEDLTGSRFEDVYLTGARFHDVDLTNARFHLVDLTGVMIRGAALVNVDISGDIKNLRVNGVDVVPLVEAELNRRYPERVKCGRPHRHHARCERYHACRAGLGLNRSADPGWFALARGMS